MVEVWGPSRGHGIPMGCWLRCWWSGRTSPTPPALLWHWRGFPSTTLSRIQPAVRMLHPRLAVMSDVSVRDMFSQAGSFSRRGRMLAWVAFWAQASPSLPSCGLHYMVLWPGNRRRTI